MTDDTQNYLSLLDDIYKDLEENGLLDSFIKDFKNNFFL